MFAALQLYGQATVGTSNNGIVFVTVDPAGSCPNGTPLQYNYSNGALWGCDSGTWTAITGGGGGGGGTVTQVNTTSPITGGPITTTGTIACATCGVTGSPLSQFAATTSAQLAGVLSDESGTGFVLFSISPALTGSPTAPTASQNDNSTKLATTAYTDLAVSNAIAAVNPAVAVLAASTASITGTYANGVSGIGATFTVTATGAFTLDGVAINTIGQRVLLKNQASGFQNGVYTATIVGTTGVSPVFTRALDFDQPSDINSTGAIPVYSGTVNAQTQWAITSNVTTVGTDAITFAQFSINPSTVATCSGDLGGTAPSCTVVNVNGGSVPISAAVLGSNGSKQPIAATGHAVSSILTCVAASASGTAYTCSTSPTFTPASGDLILFKADVANTASATLNVNSSSAATIKKQGGGTNLVANDLLAGMWTPMSFDGTNWQMEGETGNVDGTVTTFSAGNLSPLFTSSVATATTTPALTFALSTAAAQSVLAGPSAYAAAAQAPTYRTLTAQDIPSGYSSCAVLDNAICTSAVSSGNPNFLTTAANTVLPINGGTTPLVMFIGGVYQVLNTNVTLTAPSTASVPQWILAVQDTANANMVAGDFLAMNTAPAYAYTAPTCPSPSPALSATNPAFWYDLSTNLSKTCTSNGGAYSAQASMVIGVVWVDATPKVLAVAMEPYRLNPYKRFELFGNGSDGTLTITSGTTTHNTARQYASVIISAGTLSSARVDNNPNNTGNLFVSQNPVLVFGTGTIQQNANAMLVGAAGTGAGLAGGFGGLGGGGGGGGGSGATSAAGGAGANRAVWNILNNSGNVFGGGTGGAATPTAGGNATATTTVLPRFLQVPPSCTGATGGNGAGDGTNAGGRGGEAGGVVWLSAPSVVVDTGGSITANGANGAAGVGGNAGGGGGAGGGCITLNGGYVFTTNGTVTASGGTGGAGTGTGQAGGSGGAGIVQQNRMW